MRKICTKLIFTALLMMSTPAFAYPWSAPNSFETVKKDGWDYKAAYVLCEKGQAPDYTVAFFDKELTRYELASVIKNALEHTPEESRSEELNKLKKSYSRELESQGYTEKKKRRTASAVKPIYEIHGDTRVRTGSEKSDARARVEGTWHIGGNTDISVGGKTEKNM